MLKLKKLIELHKKVITTTEDEETGGIGEEAAKGLSAEMEARLFRTASDFPVSGDEDCLNGCDEQPLNDPCISAFKRVLEIVA